MVDFRREYRTLTEGEVAAIEAIKDLATDLADYYEEEVTDKRMRALALTNLEQSVMWAVKGITG